jgi:acetyl esterase/lipase
MTIGAPSDAEGLQMAHEVCEVASKPIVFAGVCYSQSPEHVFPVAVEEALIVVSYFLDKLPDRQIHISGVSAGANLASVITMEMHRRNPGRIASSSLICPMLNPAANTLSYYLNRNALFISTEWLRWCWRCYLELHDPMEQGDLMQLETMKDRLNHGSNIHAWDKSPYSKGVFARLVNPTFDMPTGLDKPEAPKFLVLTNEGDPLRDDGIDLVEKLKAVGANLKHLEHSGSHWFGTALDKGSFKELVSTWKEMLFSE